MEKVSHLLNKTFDDFTYSFNHILQVAIRSGAGEGGFSASLQDYPKDLANALSPFTNVGDSVCAAVRKMMAKCEGRPEMAKASIFLFPTVMGQISTLLFKSHYFRTKVLDLLTADDYNGGEGQRLMDKNWPTTLSVLTQCHPTRNMCVDVYKRLCGGLFESMVSAVRPTMQRLAETMPAVMLACRERILAEKAARKVEKQRSTISGLPILRKYSKPDANQPVKHQFQPRLDGFRRVVNPTDRLLRR